MTLSINVTFDIGPVLTQLGGSLVATLQDFTDKITAIQTNIDAVKTEIANLKAQLAAGGLTADQEQQVLAQLDTLNQNLTAAE